MNVLIALFVVLAIVYPGVSIGTGMMDNFGEPLVIDFRTFRKLQKRGQITSIHSDKIYYCIDGIDHAVRPCWTWYPILWLIVFFNNFNAKKLEID